jgi:outer membrane lipoprotein
MPSKRLLQLMILAVPLLFFAGCAAPVISSQIRSEATPNLSFPIAHQNVETYKGATVIWGGVIIETENQPQGSEIVVLETPLHSDERPMGATHTQGRFIARTSKFLDPVVYRKGRRITVAGTITGEETRPLGKTEYTYPIIQIKQVHLWRRELVVYPPSSYYWGWGWGWPGPWYWPYGWDYNYQWR